ncbi:MAG: hypothetical protein ABI867_13465 [Kofleriaceae bacterium]
MADDQTHEPNPFLGPKPGETLPEKKVSAAAMTRLQLAADGIAATKRAIAHQGNQVSSLFSTNMNAKYRLQVMRNSAAWEYTPEARALAGQHKEADVAAKADLAHGGNCGEHSWVAFHYLREHAVGQPINRVAPTYIDHAFVIIGDLKTDPDNAMAVSDPWTNKPTAVLWEDHFSKGPRDQVASQSTMVADGNSYKEAIMAGLKLSAYGEQMIKKADTEAETKDQTDHWKENHFWEQDDTAAQGSKFNYTVDQPAAQPGQQQQGQQPRP